MKGGEPFRSWAIDDRKQSAHHQECVQVMIAFFAHASAMLIPPAMGYTIMIIAQNSRHPPYSFSV
jgi:hypothetical protein